MPIVIKLGAGSELSIQRNIFWLLRACAGEEFWSIIKIGIYETRNARNGMEGKGRQLMESLLDYPDKQ